MTRIPTLAAAFMVAGFAAGSLVACERGGPALPDPDSEAYAAAVGDFHAGLAALQAGEAGLAEASFRRVTETAPGEPAAWADLALTALARRQPDAAAEALDRALELAPDHPRIHLIAALLAREQDRPDSAIAHLRAAVQGDPVDVRAAYLLAQMLEREGGPESRAEARRLMDRIAEAAPDNLAVQLERARLAALEGDTAAVAETLERIGPDAAVVESAASQVEAVRSALGSGSPEQTAIEIVLLQSVFQGERGYRQDQEALRVTTGEPAIMLTRFLRLPMPTARSAEPDFELAFEAETLSVGDDAWDWVRGLWLGDEVPVALIAANPRRVGIGITLDRLETFDFPGGGSTTPLPPAALAFLDYDYDFQVDLALAGPGGLRLLRQAGVGAFTDVTDAAIPAAAVSGDYAGVWAVDLDMEGDVDLVLGRRAGPPLVLWNLGDERFEAGEELAGVDGVRELAWADLDADGDPDAAVLDATGRLHVFLNRRFRTPRFERYPVPDSLAGARALATADLDRDAVLDLVTLQPDGTVRRLSLPAGPDGGWTGAVLTRWAGMTADPAAGAAADAPTTGAGAASPAVGPVGAARLFLADLDNNGDLDVVASARGVGTEVWLSTPDGLRPHASFDRWITDVADLSGEGRLDLIGVGEDGAPVMLANRGGLDYFSTTIRPRAARVAGDRRINSLGIGGEIEVRSGLLYQKQPITGPTVHFGLGNHDQLDVARIIWPNGTVQAEFDVDATNEAVTALQRLKGSCPWVFAWNGEDVEFVTDFLWRTALGLRINAQGDAAVVHAEDWIRIPGHQLAPRDGAYDIRITGELWESHFFDHVSLLAVDHPEGTETFVDERFTLPAPEPAVRLMGPLRPVAAARDQDGRDVSDLVAALDARYLDTFELGPYQGMAEEHWVEVELGAGSAAGPDPGSDAPSDTDGALWLVASGWVYPTDGSINFALAQADRPGPRGIRVEVPDGRGGWSVLEEDYGFPAGKTKTILIDLSDAFAAGAPRRVRLGTNMEVYWDRIVWAPGVSPRTGSGTGDAPSVRTTRIAASAAELRYRGFSETRMASRRAPEIPVYREIVAVTPQWRDLVGYHTRFGDVRPLLEAVDDRYVIMNAGDEMALRFPALPPPPPGWTRDFVLIGDGWVKDGDFNNGFSRTLMPLPYHGMADYDRAPTRLEDDPGYRRHPDDWRTYHTRYVTPEPFQRALLPPPGP